MNLIFALNLHLSKDIIVVDVMFIVEITLLDHMVRFFVADPPVDLLVIEYNTLSFIRKDLFDNALTQLTIH